MTNLRLKKLVLSIFTIIFLSTVLSVVYANDQADADVINVKAIDHGTSGWTFHVTVAHPDTGWDNYCDGWDVVTNEGVVLKTNLSDPFTRLLFHPHEHEQPFTRSQSRIQIPDGTKTITVRAHDIVDGFGGKEIILDLGTSEGAGYSISN